MRINKLSKKDLEDLVNRLKKRPTYVTALEKEVLGEFVEKTLLRKDDKENGETAKKRTK